MKTIDPASLVDMNACAAEYPFKVDLAYAKPGNLLFGEAIYRPDARLWLYKDLADIVCRAAQTCFKESGCLFVLYDGLRTVEAQALMLKTKRVRENPQWLEEPRLLSPPGAGGHPRAMAIDIGLEKEGRLVDMGTPFDFLAADPSPAANPAHRAHPGLSEEIIKNRAILTGAMMKAAEEMNTALLPLPQEWWDFRLPPTIYDTYAPLSDADLPPEMRMTGSVLPT
ncbi:MAG: D-Ala-D-Ala dipeptidase [Alphaproteobacteria bacterium]|nr:D-Ala-D-Ala dipeptidase [Alphaproteobacteria bacterium]